MFTLCVTTDILLEYEEIIGEHMGYEVAKNVLQIIENAVNTSFVTRYFYWNLIITDTDDNKFVDCALTTNADFIVSHDKHFNLLSRIDFPKIKVISVKKLEKLLIM